MSTLLKLNTSLFGEHGQSSQLASAFVEQWSRAHPHARVIKRDLAAQPVPHLNAASFAAMGKPAAQRSPEEHWQAALGDQLIAEIEAADVVVLGLPMYNFGVPSTLKAWFDHIARAGRTFRYTSAGPEGLLKGKQVHIFATRGGKYAGTELDSQTGFVRTFLGFLGMTEVRIVYAEGLAMGESARNTALSQAHQQIDQSLALPVAA